MRAAFGHPFTTMKTVRDVMGYKQYCDIRKYFDGLPRIGRKYFTDDVIEKIIGDIQYED